MAGNLFSFNVIRSASLPEQPANFTPGDELHLVFSEQPGEPVSSSPVQGSRIMKQVAAPNRRELGLDHGEIGVWGNLDRDLLLQLYLDEGLFPIHPIENEPHDSEGGASLYDVIPHSQSI